MNKRDTKFISRIIVLAMLSLAGGLGARIAIESDEISKVLPSSGIRDILFFFAPIASLGVIHFTLAVKSFGIRSIQTEGLIFLFVVCIFLTITAPYYFGSAVEIPTDDCSWWKMFGCSKQERRLNYPILVLLSGVGIVALSFAIKREGLVPLWKKAK